MAAVLTAAGRIALLNAQANNTNLQLSYFKVGQTNRTPTGTEVALNSEFSPEKRFDIIDESVNSNTLEVAFQDNSDMAYNASEIGLFTTGDTLFAYASHATDQQYVKTMGSLILHTFNITFSDMTTANLTFPASTLNFIQATTTERGTVELATNTEAETGTDTQRAMTPAATVAAINQHGSMPTVATQSQAETGTNNTTFMTPLRSRQAIDSQRAFSTQTQAEAGTHTSSVMTPQRTSQAITALQRGIATQTEATAGTNNARDMTPLRARQAIDSNRTSYFRAQSTDPTQTNLDDMPNDSFLFQYDSTVYTP